MKRILLLLSICLIPMLSFAQTEENEKERVYIDYFSRPTTIKPISVSYTQKHCAIK